MKLSTRISTRKLLPCVLAALLGASSWVPAEDDKQDETAPQTVAPEPSLQNGDVDGSNGINITDVLYLVNFLYLEGSPVVAASCDAGGSGSPQFVPDKANGDINGDGSINITDVLRLVTWLFNGGRAPEAMHCVAASGTV